MSQPWNRSIFGNITAICITISTWVLHRWRQPLIAGQWHEVEKITITWESCNIWMAQSGGYKQWHMLLHWDTSAPHRSNRKKRASCTHCACHLMLHWVYSYTILEAATPPWVCCLKNDLQWLTSCKTNSQAHAFIWNNLTLWQVQAWCYYLCLSGSPGIWIFSLPIKVTSCLTDIHHYSDTVAQPMMLHRTSEHVSQITFAAWK